MSSSFIYQLRKYSGDPEGQRFKLLSEKLAAFEAESVQVQAGDMKNSVKVTNSINQYKEFAAAKLKPTTTTFFLPFEPDLKFLTAWYKFDAWGKIVRDASFQGNPGSILGQTPTAAIGPDKGYGAAGTIGLQFDGSTNSIEVIDNANLKLVGQATGFSVCCLINPSTFALTPNGESRYIAEKTDDPNNLWALLLGTDGKIHFNVKVTTDFSKATTTGTVPLNVWTWIMATWNTATNTAVIYINGVSQTLSADTITDTDFGNVKTNLYVGGTGARDGFFAGGMADFRYYREKILSQAEVTNLNTNMITTSNIAFGAVATAGASLISA